MSIKSASLIRDFAATYAGPLIAAADANDVVHIWSIESFSKLLEVTTFRKAPGISVALNRGCDVVYAGSWYAGGGMAYSLVERRELWRRKDLCRFWGITADGFDLALYCYFDHKAAIRLDLATGATVERFRGLKEVWASPWAPLYLFGGRELQVGPHPTRSHFQVDRLTFAVLDVAFSPTDMAVTESGGPVRCFRLDTGEEIWRHTPDSGVHFIHLSFCESMQMFVGIEWAYQSRGESRLMAFTNQSGALKYISNIPSAGSSIFCRSGSLLVSSQGDVFDVPSGRVIHKLEFPYEQYEDPEFPAWEARMQSSTPEEREFARFLGPPKVPKTRTV